MYFFIQHVLPSDSQFSLFVQSSGSVTHRDHGGQQTPSERPRVLRHCFYFHTVDGADERGAVAAKSLNGFNMEEF